MKTRSMHLVPFAFFGLVALVGGCSGQSPEEASIASARQAIKGNSDYMRKQVEERGEMGRVKIDLADNRQFQFLDARLRASGITPETAPSLHAKLHAARDAAVAKKNGKLADGAAQFGAGDPPRCDVFVVPETLDDTTFRTLTRGTCVGGADYTYVDTYQLDEDDNGIGYDFVEDFGDGVKVDLYIDSVPTPQRAVYADAITYQETSSTVESYYYVTPVYDNNLVTPTPAVTGILEAPVDVLPNGLIKYCLDRKATNTDCDYEHGSYGCNGNSICEANVPKFEADPLPFNGNLLYMPMKGHSAPVVPTLQNNPYAVETAKAWLTLRNAGSTTPPGGFCTKDLTGSPFIHLSPDEQNPQRSKVVIDPKAPSLGNANWPDHCSDNGRNVDLNIEVTLKQPGCVGARCRTTTVRWTTLPTDLNPYAPPVQIWWGCLSQGTRITLADGTNVAIESMAIGQKVLSDEHGRALTVVDITEGAERRPMVRVASDRGGVVTMTATHAVPIGEGRFVQAEDLKVGDRIETKDGPATIVAVDRPEIEGAVYNLVLGTEEELAEIGPNATTMYADGVLVGDGRMQGVLTEQAHAEELASGAKEIPAEKQFDYARALERAEKKAQKQAKR